MIRCVCLFVSNFLPSTYQLLLSSCLLLAARVVVCGFFARCHSGDAGALRWGVFLAFMCMVFATVTCVTIVPFVDGCFPLCVLSNSARFPVSAQASSPSTCQCIRLLPRALWIWPSPVVSISVSCIEPASPSQIFTTAHIHAQRGCLASERMCERERVGESTR